MTPVLNLHILAKRFTQLSKAAFFDPAFQEFSQRTVEAIVHVIENESEYPDDVVRDFVGQVWRVMQFVRGSRSNEAPYETQFVLRKVLEEWIPKEALVSSAALDDFNFFLSPADLWEHISKTLHLFDTRNYRPLVVRIGAPEAYKHRPIFCVPLFHELGHFVDHYYKVSEISLLLHPPGNCPPGLPMQHWNMVNLHHRMEFFADLFGSCYCGNAAVKSLSAIAPDHPDSATHPSTGKRVDTMTDFLKGNQNVTVDIIQEALEARNLRQLEPQFSIPDLVASLNDVTTYRIQNLHELYGIYPAGWDYLENQIEERTAPWIAGQVDGYIIEKTVNDLVEKSIRNFEIKERWEFGAADKNEFK